jgi:hypothetical protein
VVYCCSKKQQEGNDILYVLFFPCQNNHS